MEQRIDSELKLKRIRQQILEKGSIVILASGRSVLGLDISELRQNSFVVSLNYSFRYFDPHLLFYVDSGVGEKLYEEYGPTTVPFWVVARKGHEGGFYPDISFEFDEYLHFSATWCIDWLRSNFPKVDTYFLGLDGASPSFYDEYKADKKNTVDNCYAELAQFKSSGRLFNGDPASPCDSLYKTNYFEKMKIGYVCH